MDELIRETMISYNEYLLKLPNGCQKIADDIRQDDLREALNGILQVSEGTTWLLDVNTLLEKNSFSNPLNPDKIHEFLNEVNNGLELQDYVIVADMFEYEIKPFFESCKVYEIVS